MTPAADAVPASLVEAFARDGHVLVARLVPVDALGSYGSVAPAGSSDEALAAVAARLLGATRVSAVERRLEWSRPCTSIGPWQRDADRLGADTPLVTMWLPLQDTSVDLGTPQYASGTVTREDSDRFLAGLASDPDRSHPIDTRYPVTAVAPLAAGDASFHGGWTAYRMFGNTTTSERLAAVITWTVACEQPGPSGPDRPARRPAGR